MHRISAITLQLRTDAQSAVAVHVIARNVHSLVDEAVGVGLLAYARASVITIVDVSPPVWL